jgi:hypothetical protein
MKLELKENMYVRNCYGRIAKIEDIEDNIAYCDNWLYQRYEEFITFIDLNNEKDINEITKVSFDIIDILEVGDYVNGYPIYEIVEYEDDTRAIVIADDNKSIIWKKQNIKSVITHEQMEQMAYKAGE